MIFLGQSGFGGLGFGSLWAWGLGGGGGPGFLLKKLI